MLFVAYCGLAVSSPDDGNARLNCLIDHLKTAKRLEADFPNFPGEVPNDCSVIIATVANMANPENTGGVNNYYDECIVENMKMKSNLLDEFFIAMVYSESPAVTREKYTAKVAEFSKLREAWADGVKRICKLRAELKDAYKQMYDVDLQTEYEHDKRNAFTLQCVITNAFDTNLLDAKISKAPKLFDFSSIEGDKNCEDAVKTYYEDLESNIKRLIRRTFKEQTTQDCAVEKMRKSGLAQTLTKLFVVAVTQDRNEEQKALDKQMFYEFIDKVVNDIEENCVNALK